MTADVAPGRRERGWWRTLGQGLRVFVDRVLLEPIREGRLRNDGWPPGLAAISGLALLVYVLASSLIVLAPLLRQVLPLYATDTTPKPFVSLAVLFGGLTFALILLQTAALHGHWLWRTVGTATTMLSMVWLGLNLTLGLASTVSYAAGLGLLSVLCMLGILVVLVLRRRRTFSWWEFAVISVLVGSSTLLPVSLIGLHGVLVGTDLRPTVAVVSVTILAVVAIPALVVAGSALAELAVSSANWGLALLEANASPRAWPGVVLGFLVLRVAQVILLYRADPEPWSFENFLGLPPVLVLAVLLVLLMRRLARARLGRAPRLPSPAELAEGWGPIRIVVALMFFAVTLLIVAVVTVAASPLVSSEAAPRWLVRAVEQQGSQGLTPMLMAAAGGVGCLVAARRGRLGTAVVLAGFAIAGLSWTSLRLPVVSTIAQAWTAETLGVSAGVLALLAMAWLRGRGRLTRDRGFALTLVFVLGIAYDLRELLDEPLSWLLGFSGMAVALFGVLWRVLTDGEYTRGDSRNLPQASRVLFFWANALVAVFTLAQVALGRETGADSDWNQYVAVGDLMLGVPLYLAALLACFWSALAGSLAPTTR